MLNQIRCWREWRVQGRELNFGLISLNIWYTILMLLEPTTEGHHPASFETLCKLFRPQMHLRTTLSHSSVMIMWTHVPSCKYVTQNERCGSSRQEPCNIFSHVWMWHAAMIHDHVFCDCRYIQMCVISFFGSLTMYFRKLYVQNFGRIKQHI